MAVIWERSKKQDVLTEKYLTDISVAVWSISGPLYASAHTVAVSGHPSHVTCKALLQTEPQYFYSSVQIAVKPDACLMFG